MNRLQIVLSSLVAVLIVVAFYFLVMQPQLDELAEVDEQIEAQQQEQVNLQSDIDRLRSVREDAPEVEAEVAAAEAIVPTDPSLPSALRQLQTAADDAGVVLGSVTTERPVDLEVGPDGLSAINVNLQLSGSYFQLVDFLRRVEDPTITPRGAVFSDVNLGVEEYPDLNVSLSGQVFALIETSPPPEAEDDAEAEDDGEGEGSDDSDLDLEEDLDDPEDQS
ncbi:MAG: type II secretion system protein GspM [Nitriliruptoraceae bacterium]